MYYNTRMRSLKKNAIKIFLCIRKPFFNENSPLFYFIALFSYDAESKDDSLVIISKPRNRNEESQVLSIVYLQIKTCFFFNYFQLIHTPKHVYKH